MSDDKEKEVEWKTPIKPDGDNNMTRGPQPKPQPSREPRPVKW